MTSIMHQPLGVHLLADLHGIAEEKLNQPEVIESILRHSAQAAGAQIVFSHVHSFGAGQGVTGVVLLAESHISVHTWPENCFAAVDIFMCGEAEPQRALECIQQALQPVSCSVYTRVRGGGSRLGDV